MCRLLGVSSSGYYCWRTRPPSERSISNEVVTEKIRLVHDQSRKTYGYRRMTTELVEVHGEQIGQDRVARLMSIAGIQGLTRRKFCRTTRRDKRARPAPDLLKRDFCASRPNERWVADITYVPTWAGFLFLAVVVDIFTRKVVGWSMAANQNTELVTNALQMALLRQRPHGVVIHHSDQGCQYTSHDFATACRAAGVERSMGSVGDCFDNAMAESFFATLECELIDRSVFEDRDRARMAIFEYIEGLSRHLAPTLVDRKRMSRGIRAPLARQRLLRQCCMNQETRCPRNPRHSNPHPCPVV
jgi:putative transposase